MKSLLRWYQIWRQVIFKREEESLASSLLNIICRQNWYQHKSDYMDRAFMYYAFFSKHKWYIVQGVLCLCYFVRLWKNNHVSRKLWYLENCFDREPCKWRTACTCYIIYLLKWQCYLRRNLYSPIMPTFAHWALLLLGEQITVLISDLYTHNQHPKSWVLVVASRADLLFYTLQHIARNLAQWWAYLSTMGYFFFSKNLNKVILVTIFLILRIWVVLNTSVVSMTSTYLITWLASKT